MSHTTDETMEVKANGGAKQQTVKEENKNKSLTIRPFIVYPYTSQLCGVILKWLKRTVC